VPAILGTMKRELLPAPNAPLLAIPANHLLLIASSALPIDQLPLGVLAMLDSTKTKHSHVWHAHQNAQPALPPPRTAVLAQRIDREHPDVHAVLATSKMQEHRLACSA
jgi:hypothetical protein